MVETSTPPTVSNIPLLDLDAQLRGIRPELDAALARVVDRTDFIQGMDLELFEREFADYCATTHSVGVSSGTDALVLALMACGVGRGDEVITTPLTFIATAEAICQVGATPVFVDIDPSTFNIDPARLDSAISRRTRAVMPVHLYGSPADMADIIAVANAHRLRVVEDAAQAHGATYRGQPAGGIGDVGCFSFYPGKNLGALGDAGAVTTNNDEIAATVQLLRDHGRSEKYLHRRVAFNARMDTIQAAVLRVKLRHLDQWNQQRIRVAQRYRELLRGTGVRFHEEQPDRQSVYHQFVVRVGNRDKVAARLKSDGISTGVHYPIPLHLQPALSELGYSAGDFPHSEVAARDVLSLPIFPELTEEQACKVVDSLVEALHWIGTDEESRRLENEPSQR